jgi:hypothetical protein
MSTVNQIAQFLVREHSESSDDPNYISILEGWIIETVEEIAAAGLWKFFRKDYSFATVASTFLYILPSEAKEMDFLRFTDTNLPLDFLNPARLPQFGEDFERLARPYVWWYEDAGTVSASFTYKIRLFPTPDTVYTIEAPYYYVPTGLTTSSDLPLHQEFLSTMKLRVRAFMDKDDGDYDGYDRMMSKYESRLTTLKAANETKPDARRRLQVTDLGVTDSRGKYARLDPSHFRSNWGS